MEKGTSDKASYSLKGVTSGYTLPLINDAFNNETIMSRSELM